MVQPSKIALAPFILCAKLLEFLGQSFGLTYKEISVVVNLWIQGSVLMISGVLPFIKALATKGFVATILGLAFYALIWVCGFIWMLWHYRLPFERAFDLCVNDLLWLADRCKLSYHAINLILFIGFFLSLLALNIKLYLAL